MEICDLDSVAGVLKLYFRGMENPLFPKDSYEELMECGRKRISVCLTNESIFKSNNVYLKYMSNYERIHTKCVLTDAMVFETTILSDTMFFFRTNEITTS